MPTDCGTLNDFIGGLDARLLEKGLDALPLDTIAPLCIYLFADLEWRSSARKAFASLKRRKHRVLAIKETGRRDEFGNLIHPTRFVVPGDLAFDDLHDPRPGLAVDLQDLHLLYRQALCTEIARHLDPDAWRVEVDRYGAYGLARDEERCFVGDENGAFAWYADAAAVGERCGRIAREEREAFRR